jgi:hypothetical protein
MRRPLGLTLIIKFYSIIGGLTLALSFFQILSVNNYGMKLVFIDPCLDFIAENTILTKEILESLPESIMTIFAFIVTFITSLFHTLLAEALYLGNSKAYLFGILFHSYSAFSSFALWMLGINTLKLIGVFLLFMNLVKATYLYNKRVRGELP